MPSDRRLHPASILFVLASQLRQFAVPGLLLLVSAGSAGLDWQNWTLVFIVPYTLVAVLRYASFTYRYEADDIVIRTGFIFRNERHVPYTRIQNVDAVQNVVHRLLGVVEVRLETGGGQQPEARLSVLPLPAFEEMRRKVLDERARAGAGAVPVEVSAESSERVLLHLSIRELAIGGLIENRGFVIIAAALGLLWEFGQADGVLDRVFGDAAAGRGVLRDAARAIFAGGGIAFGRIALAIGAFALLLAFVRVLSMLWALIRLYDFTLSTDGDDLHSTFGLFTRVTATVPLRRIQTLTIREGPLHRLLGRASVRVETAGGGGPGTQGATSQREWLAPIILKEKLPGFLSAVLPGVELSTIDWKTADPPAYRRALRIGLLFTLPMVFVLAWLLRWWSVLFLPLPLLWATVGAHKFVQSLRWGFTDHAVAFRSGWIWRAMTVARFSKIQTVTLHESPFDRRWTMASVRIDTAGASESSHRVDIPFLRRDAADELLNRLASRAEQTEFRW
jgi:putative membrane protein